MLGSFLFVLPVFGLWMMPLGLLLLAIDLPVLRPRVNAALIRLRRWWTRPQTPLRPPLPNPAPPP